MSRLRDHIAVAAATESDPGAVAVALPTILAELEAHGILKPNVVIGVLATAAVEAHFRPVIESWWIKVKSRARWERWADGTKYGKVDPTTKQRYVGRGLVQLTWRGNYAKAGAALGLDLVRNPDLALEPEVAARILVWYFRQKGGLVDACLAGNWRRVRLLVNGGYNGWADFNHYVTHLLALSKEA